MSAQSRATFGAGGEWIFDVIKRNPEGLCYWQRARFL